MRVTQASQDAGTPVPLDELENRLGLISLRKPHQVTREGAVAFTEQRDLLGALGDIAHATLLRQDVQMLEL